MEVFEDNQIGKNERMLTTTATDGAGVIFFTWKYLSFKSDFHNDIISIMLHNCYVDCISFAIDWTISCLPGSWTILRAFAFHRHPHRKAYQMKVVNFKEKYYLWGSIPLIPLNSIIA